MVPRTPEPYRLDPDFEAQVVTLACSRQQFYGRIGHEIDPELLKDKCAKIAMRAARSIALEHGCGPTSLSIVLQRLRRWMADGKVTLEQINEVNDFFDDTIDAGIPDEESVIAEIKPILQQRIRDMAVQAGIDSFSKKGDLSKVVELENRAKRVGTTPPELAVKLTRLSDIEVTPIMWLWQGRIARGSLTLVDGDPGQGKSTLIVDIAARVSAGLPMPFCERPQTAEHVVILAAEDSASTTIRPRLIAAGGDPDRVHVLSTVPDARGDERIAVLPDDLELLEPILRTMRPGLIIIDPLLAFLNGKVDSHRDQDVKRALTRLSKFAESLNVAVVAIRHLNKTGDDRALYRGGGSIGIVGAARSALLVGKDPHDDTARILAPVKNNLSAFAKSLRFKIVPALIPTKSSQGEQVDVGSVEWLDECELRADELVARPNERAGELERARDFLTHVLADGPMPGTKVIEAASDEGITKRTLDRARRALGVEAEKQTGPHGAWHWSLPSTASAPGARGGEWDGRAARSPDLDGVPPSPANGNVGNVDDLHTERSTSGGGTPSNAQGPTLPTLPRSPTIDA